MATLPQLIPDVQVLLALEPEELAGKLLFLLKTPSDIRGRDMFGMSGVLAECSSA